MIYTHDKSRATYRVVEKFVHPRFSGHDIDYNVGLYKLDRSVKMGYTINTACLSTKQFTGDEMLNCETSGFGSTSRSSKINLFLKIFHYFSNNSINYIMIFYF